MIVRGWYDGAGAYSSALVQYGVLQALLREEGFDFRTLC